MPYAQAWLFIVESMDTFAQMLGILQSIYAPKRSVNTWLNKTTISLIF